MVHAHDCLAEALKIRFLSFKIDEKINNKIVMHLFLQDLISGQLSEIHGKMIDFHFDRF